MDKDDEREFRIRPRKPPARSERAAWASAYKILMHHARMSSTRKHQSRTGGGPKRVRGANVVANKAPYTDEELQNIIDARDRLGEIAWSNGRESGCYTGEDVKDFIWVMIYTGLRISDIGLFNMSRLKGNEVFLRAKKNGGQVFAYIPDWLRGRLNARATRCGMRPFVLGHSDRLETVTDM